MMYTQLFFVLNSMFPSAFSYKFEVPTNSARTNSLPPISEDMRQVLVNTTSSRTRCCCCWRVVTDKSKDA